MPSYQPSPSPSPFTVPGTYRERRSLDFFYYRPVAHLTGFYGCDFWSRWVLQASHHDAGIRHAVIALSAVYERFEKVDRRDNDDDDVEHFDFGLRQYNLAIKTLICGDRGTKQIRPTMDAYLASCIIFICIEVWLLS